VPRTPGRHAFVFAMRIPALQPACSIATSMHGTIVQPLAREASDIRAMRSL
jgi:hypothetical protein